MRPRLIIHVNDKFARLTVLEHIGQDEAAKTVWLCLCDCGKRTYARTAQLSSGMKQSCGCLVRENAAARNVTHGMTVRGSFTPEYGILAHMKDRCDNPSNQAYQRYGGRGIRVCAHFETDFMNFLNCVGFRPTPQHSIDRIENDGHYSCGQCLECVENGWPLNVKWSTKKEQSQNRSITVWITHDGETKCLAEWSRVTGFAAQTIRGRLAAGWLPGLALTIPPSKQNRIKLDPD